MTDEERQSTLCHALRTADCNYNIDGEPVTKRAADEIERLAALAQSDAEPFPQPQRNDGGEPCGECHLRPGETCDVCGAKAQSDAEPVAWQLVPIEPTPAMLKRGDQGQTPEYIWEAMLFAAPAPPRPDASEMDQLKADLRNTYQRLETVRASEEGWKRRCQFVEAERDEARASRPDASAGLIEATDAIEGLLSEWDKFCKYGSPMAKLANEHVTYARNVLSDLRARAADRSGK